MSNEKELKPLEEAVRQYLSKFPPRPEPIGFKCWDCDKEVTGLDVKDEFFKKNPISLDGYIQTFCDECGANDDY